MSTDHAAEVITQWMSSYLTRPHAQINRAGAVCPFVEPALAMDAVRIRAISSVGPRPERYVAEATRRALRTFPPSDLLDHKKALRALVLVFPDLMDRGHVIDRVHAEVKDGAVRRGLMVGQLHPECDEPSARNPTFPVNRSPVPLLAVRHMAVHDILFLKDRRPWFVEYDRRFGHLFEGGSRVDPVLREQYEHAVAAFGPIVHAPDPGPLARTA